jgi:hypothetical protein
MFASSTHTRITGGNFNNVQGDMHQVINLVDALRIAESDNRRNYMRQVSISTLL